MLFIHIEFYIPVFQFPDDLLEEYTLSLYMDVASFMQASSFHTGTGGQGAARGAAFYSDQPDTVACFIEHMDGVGCGL